MPTTHCVVTRQSEQVCASRKFLYGSAQMMQIPFPESLPPGFLPMPFDWFQFALLYLACLEAVLLAMPSRWRDKLIEVAFCLRKKTTGTIED